MTSPNLRQTQCDAADAFDLEQDLLALTTAALDDGDEAALPQCVDEFAPEFLMGLNPPSRHGRFSRRP